LEIQGGMALPAIKLTSDPPSDARPLKLRKASHHQSNHSSAVRLCANPTKIRNQGQINSGWINFCLTFKVLQTAASPPRLFLGRLV
jgi:hypothetical protein